MNDELARGWPAARALFATEARLLVRDRRTLFTALVLPLLVLPLMFGLMSWSNVQREERVESREYLWAVSGDAAALATTLFEAGEAASAEPIADDASTAPEIELRRIEVEDPEAALRAGELAVWVEALGVEAARQRLAEERAAAESEQRSESVAEAANGDGASVAEPAAVPNLRIHLIGNRDASSTAAGALRERLDRARLERRAEAFEAAGLGTAEQDVAAIVESYLEIRQSQEVQTPGGGSVEMTRHYSDFRKVGELTMYHKMEIDMGGNPSGQGIEFTKFELLDPSDIDDAMFAMPAVGPAS